MSIYTVNRGRREQLFERTVEDRLSEGNKLFQPEKTLFSHKLLYFKGSLTPRLNGAEGNRLKFKRKYTTEDIPSKVVIGLSLWG